MDFDTERRISRDILYSITLHPEAKARGNDEFKDFDARQEQIRISGRELGWREAQRKKINTIARNISIQVRDAVARVVKKNDAQFHDLIVQEARRKNAQETKNQHNRADRRQQIEMYRMFVKIRDEQRWVAEYDDGKLDEESQISQMRASLTGPRALLFHAWQRHDDKYYRQDWDYEYEQGLIGQALRDEHNRCVVEDLEENASHADAMDTIRWQAKKSRIARDIQHGILDFTSPLLTDFIASDCIRSDRTLGEYSMSDHRLSHEVDISMPKGKVRYQCPNHRVCASRGIEDYTMIFLCGHSYCRDCLMGLYEASLSEKELFPPRCCRVELGVPYRLKYFLGEDFTSEYLAREAIELTLDN